MRKIVFINQDSGYLMIDIVNAYAEKGYECVLMTGRLIERNNPLDKRVKVECVAKYNRISILSRLFSWILSFVQIWFKTVFRYRDAELFIVSNPPFVPLLPLFCKNKFMLMIFDVYIEKPNEIATLRKFKFLINRWQKAHEKVLSKADRVFTLTDGMADVLEKYSKENRVEVVPIWTDNTYFKPIEKSINPFVKKHSLQDKFIVLYSGNLGASSGVESLIETARKIENNDICFLIIGGGIRKEMLMRKSKEYNLKNCMFLPWQDTGTLPYSMASADLAVVSLAGSASKRSIPSKLFNYLSVGSPVLSISNNDSDLSKTVNSLNVGKSFQSNQIGDIATFITELYRDKAKQSEFSENAINASKKFTVENVNIITDKA